MKKLLPLILLVIGTAAGGGVGYVLRPAPEPVEEMADGDAAKTEDKDADTEKPVEYVKLNNQFVVPVVQDRVVTALVVMALSLEAVEGSKEEIFRREPKLRDSFLQVLFDHANVGGFDGAFTQAGALDQLRVALREVAQRDLGKEMISDVLILEIARQDY
ncbi:MAG: flagellar basal body-associated protein FliL [Pseudomonadota bacterium]